VTLVLSSKAQIGRNFIKCDTTIRTYLYPGIEDAKHGFLMKFAVTGANGFIGHYICRELLEQGHEVRAFIRDPKRARGLDLMGAELVIGDFSDWDSVERMMRGCDAVFHNGYWQGHPVHSEPTSEIDYVRFFEYNLLGLYKMLAFCRDNGIRNFFLTSSGAAIGAYPARQEGTNAVNAAGLVDESYPCSPSTEYAAFKRTCEIYIATFNKQYTMGHFSAFRPLGNIIGVPMRDITRTCFYEETVAMLKNDPVYTDLEIDCPTGHARDLARAAIAIAGKPDDEPVEPLYHIPGIVYPRVQVMEKIKEITDSCSELIHEPYAKRHTKPLLELSSDKRVRGLGFDFCGMDGVVEQTTELMDILQRQT